ncbi:MAG TPA: efflux transporter outer membrane subunit [Steroidobacteraceae bacterium]|jgi:multidrug efflux system outer membrane protein
MARCNALLRMTLGGVLLLWLSACSLAPRYVRPADPETASLVRSGDVQVTDAPVESEFWKSLNDARLSGLIDDALSANHDLRIGLARLNAARALLRESRLNQLPVVTASGQAGDGRSSADQFPGVARGDRDAETYQLGIDAFWELDFFGRVRNSVKAQRAEARAAAADLAALQVLVVGELAQAYFEHEGLLERLNVARTNAINQRDSLQLVEARLNAGRGTEFDTARASAQLQSTLGRIPPLEAAAAIAEHRIAVLTGREPDALRTTLETPAVSVTLPLIVAAGTPGDLLRRRPDVIAAEHRLEGAAASVGVATADLFPRFTIGASVGTQASDVDALFKRDSETRFVALGIDWSFLDVGRVRARMAAADANSEANLAAYQQTVLRALEETQNALVRYDRALREQEHLRAAAADNTKAATLARLRFNGGITDFLDVLDAERSQLEAQDQLAQSEARSATALIALYKSLAGGWPDRRAVAAGP